MNYKLYRFQDRWNPNKVWMIKKYNDNHYYVNQTIDGVPKNKHYIKYRREMIEQIDSEMITGAEEVTNYIKPSAGIRSIKSTPERLEVVLKANNPKTAAAIVKESGGLDWTLEPLTDNQIRVLVNRDGKSFDQAERDFRGAWRLIKENAIIQTYIND